jgi:4'-phosphopantetheinyl transferase
VEQDNPDCNLKALEREAHVWITRPDNKISPDWLAENLALLSSDERERYQRFRFDRDRIHFLAAHALVRRVLSRYAGSAPAEWRFSTTAQGRPEIESPETAQGLRFNLTHTQGLCACVVTLNHDCGIDAEETARAHNLAMIAERMFAPTELEAIGDLADAGAQLRFYRHWTLREAYIKALGQGLSGSSKRFYFSDTECETPRLVMDDNPDAHTRWQLALMQPDDNHLLAVAVRREPEHDLNIVVRTFGN